MSEITEKLFAIIRANEEKGVDTQIHLGHEEWAVLRNDEDAARNLTVRPDGSTWFAGCLVVLPAPPEGAATTTVKALKRAIAEADADAKGSENGCVSMTVRDYNALRAAALMWLATVGEPA